MSSAARAALLAAIALGCGKDSSGPGGPAGSGGGAGAGGASGGFDRKALLRNVAEGILVPTYRDFDAAARALVDRTAQACAALGTPEAAARWAAAQDAWRAAMVAWQHAEVMLFGPAAMDEKALRDRVYSWPVTNRCAVDQEIMTRHRDPAAYDLASKLSNRRGLPALEHVLFTESLETVCAPQAAPMGWAELPEAERRAARCGFAQAAAQDLAAQAQTVLDAWLPERGNYLATFVGAGEDGSSIPSAQEAVNLVSDALFYVDRMVKDMKLGEPAGISRNSCGVVDAPCLAELESPIANHSKQNVLANLDALARVLAGRTASGEDGVGFDDFLVAAGAGDLATQMAADVAAARARVEAIPGTLAEAVVQHREAVRDAHGALKTVTNELKSRFLTTLGLDIPDDAAADND